MKTGVLAALFLLSVGSAAAGGYPEVSDERSRRYMEQLPNVDVLDTEPRYNGGTSTPCIFLILSEEVSAWGWGHMSCMLWNDFTSIARCF